MSTGSPSQANPERFERTKRRIQGLVREISQMSKLDVDPERYYAEFMQRTVTALAAVGGAIWHTAEGGRVKAGYQMNVPPALLERDSDEGKRHFLLLEKMLRSGEPLMVPPFAGEAEEGGAGNPTRCLLLLAPLKSDNQVEGVVEIFQRPGTPPEVQRGYLQFLLQVCEMASEWLKGRKLRHFSDRQTLWQQADEFAGLAHESLDRQQTTFTIANEGRRLIECDRVSVAVDSGGYCYVEAVSGQDTPDTRSNVVTLLSELATRVVATGEPLWYEGSTDNLPPQLEEAIQEYVDEAHTRTLVVLPLHAPPPAAVDPERNPMREQLQGDVIGALIVEQIEDTQPREALEQRVDMVRRHAALALNNSLEYNNLFLMPVWRLLGQMMWIFKAGTLPKTLAVIALIIAAGLAMWLVPWDFTVESDGTLEPKVKQEVFVKYPGIVPPQEQLEIKSDYQQGEEILTLQDSQLAKEIIEVQGEIDSTIKRLESIENTLLKGKLEVDPAERTRLESEKSEAEIRLSGLERKLETLNKTKELLVVTSPIQGEVITWNAEERIANRPVDRGQSLFTIADTDQGWHVRLLVPEHRMKHLADAQREFGDELDVVFVLASQPDKRYTGKVKKVEQAAQIYEENKHAVRVYVELDEPLPHPRQGATLIAHIYCGQAPIGYVWFHDLIDWFNKYVLF